MPRPPINYDLEYNLNQDLDISPFMQAEWEGRDAYLAGKEYATCPYKDLHFSQRWAEGYCLEAQHGYESLAAILAEWNRKKRGKKT